MLIRITYFKLRIAQSSPRNLASSGIRGRSNMPTARSLWYSGEVLKLSIAEMVEVRGWRGNQKHAPDARLH
ncbi:hypothetical protein PZA11_006688 [Diplocarpon coronariae]